MSEISDTKSCAVIREHFIDMRAMRVAFSVLVVGALAAVATVRSPPGSA
jgi:hypothetical protein